MPKARKSHEPSAAEVTRAKEALLKELAADAALATAEYKAMQEARRANTERLRALRLAKEAAEQAKERGGARWETEIEMSQRRPKLDQRGDLNGNLALPVRKRKMPFQREIRGAM